MKKLLVAASVWLLVGGIAPAQTGRGVITGVVLDKSGAVIPGSEVTVTNLDTQVQYNAVSNEQGLYSVLNLPPGAYSAAFRKEGMRSYEQTGITVFVNQTVQLDVTLEVGAVTESVTVTANAGPLNTQTSDVGTGIDHRTILDLPLPIDGGRSLESFAYAVTPSVEGNAWTSYVNGGPAFSKEALLDGTTATVQIGGDIEATSPSLEAVEQFKVETSGMPAEFGRTGGGVFVFAMKSGTNQFHGSAVSFLRNEVLNANSWNNNYLLSVTPSEKDLYKRSRDRQFTYAFSGGGPIVANKTFVFAAYEHFFRDDYTLGSFSQTVPVPAFLDGDFSALLNTSEAAALGLDSAGNNVFPGAIIDPQGGALFPNNTLPQSRLSTVSRKIADIYRAQYQPLIPGRLINNNALPGSNNTHSSTSQFSIKLDHHFTEKSSIAGSFILVNQPRLLVDSGGIWDPKDPGLTGGPL